MGSIGTYESSFGIGFACPILGGACVGLRFYSRWYLRNDLRADDWLCLPALLCTTACCASLLVRAFHDTPGVPDDARQKQFTAQITGAIILFWAWANTFVKLSVLFFYRRIFRGRIYTLLNNILVGCCLVWLVFDIVGWLLFCGTDLRANFEGPWDECPAWGFQLQIGVFLWDMLNDLAILVLPIPAILRLHLNLSKKIAILLIFLLGGFAFVAGLSNAIIQVLSFTNPDFLNNTSQNSYFEGLSILIYNWPALEVGVGLIAAQLPSLSFRALASLPRQLRSFHPQRYPQHSTDYAMQSSAQQDKSHKSGDFRRLHSDIPLNEVGQLPRVRSEFSVEYADRYPGEEDVILPPLRPALLRQELP